MNFQMDVWVKGLKPKVRVWIPYLSWPVSSTKCWSIKSKATLWPMKVVNSFLPLVNCFVMRWCKIKQVSGHNSMMLAALMEPPCFHLSIFLLMLLGGIKKMWTKGLWFDIDLLLFFWTLCRKQKMIHDSNKPDLSSDYH